MSLALQLAWKLIPQSEQQHLRSLMDPLTGDQFVRLLRGRQALPPAFNRLRCIFVHIPKTAGTSVTDSLFGHPRPTHLPLTWYETVTGPDYPRYFKFAFVRNPWDRLASAYHYMATARHKKKEDSLEWVAFVRSFRSFEHFVMDWVTPENVCRQITFMPQHRFVLNKFGMLGLDYVGRFESLAEDFSTVCARLGIDSQLPHHKKSDRPDFRSLYTDEMREIVANAYRQDIALFNYTFE